MAKRVYRGRRGRWNIWILAIPAVLVLGAGSWMLWSTLRPAPAQSAPMVPLNESRQIEPGPSPQEPSGPLAPDASSDAGEALEAGSTQDAYDFTQPAPETEAVDNSYFEDAAFVGDSRTDGS